MYYVSDSSAELSNSLSADLTRVADWVVQNGLKLNEMKVRILLLSRKRRAKELDNVVVKLNEKATTACRLPHWWQHYS